MFRKTILATLLIVAIIACNGVALAWDVELQWDASPADQQITGYNVYKSAASGTGFTLIAPSPTNTFTDTNPATLRTAFYVVTAVNATGESPFSNEVMADRPLALPGAPTGLQIIQIIP